MIKNKKIIFEAVAIDFIIGILATDLQANHNKLEYQISKKQ